MVKNRENWHSHWYFECIAGLSENSMEVQGSKKSIVFELEKCPLISVFLVAYDEIEIVWATVKNACVENLNQTPCETD